MMTETISVKAAINAVIDALKFDNDTAQISQSDRDYESLQRMIRAYGVSNVVSMLAQACGNVNPCDGSLVSEDYDRAEEILSAAAVGVDFYYEKKIDASHINLRENQIHQMIELMNKVKP